MDKLPGEADRKDAGRDAGMGGAAPAPDAAAAPLAGPGQSAPPGCRGRFWRPAVIALIVFGLVIGAFILGTWYNRHRYVCVMTPAGTVVCGQSSGPAGVAGAGEPLVQPQGRSYRDGRRKVTETRCHEAEDGSQSCQKTERYE
jgi:hypothetical protein